LTTIQKRPRSTQPPISSDNTSPNTWQRIPLAARSCACASERPATGQRWREGAAVFGLDFLLFPAFAFPPSRIGTLVAATAPRFSRSQLHFDRRVLSLKGRVVTGVRLSSSAELPMHAFALPQTQFPSLCFLSL
jgi:hypothetical protein